MNSIIVTANTEVNKSDQAIPQSTNVDREIKKLVIFGVGLIGGSVALALKNTKKPPQIVGVGRRMANLTLALELGVIDYATDDIADAMQEADLVLIATPVAQTPAILSALLPHLSEHTIVTDAGSTKVDVMGYAQQILGEKSAQFIGSHPIAGAEKSGVSAAFAALYQQKNIVLTPTETSSLSALNLVTSLWQQCGGIVSHMSATTHDGIFAAVSHLPHLLAFALVDELASRHNAEQLFNFAASGFRDFTRIAGSHPEMWRDITLANQTALLEEITAYQHKLTALKSMLEASNSEALEALFARASQARNAWASHSLNPPKQ